MPRSRPWAALAREPALHFLVAGAALVCVESLSPASSAGTPPDALERANLGAQNRPEIHVPPAVARTLSNAERQRWIDDEVLAREAMASATEHDPTTDRARLAAWMRAVLRQSVHLAPPTEADVRTFYADHQARYSEDARVDLEVLRCPAAAATNGMLDGVLAALANGTPAERISGCAWTSSARMRAPVVARTHGAAVAEAIDTLALGVWTPIASADAVQVVALSRRRPAGPPRPFEAVRERVRLDLQRTRVEAAVRARVEALHARYRVVMP